MSWKVTISGHETDGPNPPDEAKLVAVRDAAVAAAKAEGLTPTYAETGTGHSKPWNAYDAAEEAEASA